MNKLKIGLDVDDVICAFTPCVFNWLGKEMPEKLDYWSVEVMDKYLGKNWFTEIIQHEEEFWKGLHILSSPTNINFEISCYMSAFPTKMFHTRYQWLIDHGFPEAPLILTQNKLKVCKQLGMNILIDDKADTIKQLQDTEVRGIHFINEYADFEPIGEFITNLKDLKI